MQWTDEAIERELRLCPKDADVWRSALLELKRVRAWAKHGRRNPERRTKYDYWCALTGIVDGDPAPTEAKQEPSE